jgi:hypothetical protein
MIIYNAGNDSLNKKFSNEKEYKNYPYWEIFHFNENNEIHREDGPAVEYSDGDKFWYKNSERHRENGPAVDYSNGDKKYWYNDEYIDVKTDKEFKKYLKLKCFI